MVYFPLEWVGEENPAPEWEIPDGNNPESIGFPGNPRWEMPSGVFGLISVHQRWQLASICDHLRQTWLVARDQYHIAAGAVEMRARDAAAAVVHLAAKVEPVAEEVDLQAAAAAAMPLGQNARTALSGSLVDSHLAWTGAPAASRGGIVGGIAVAAALVSREMLQLGYREWSIAMYKVWECV